MTKYHTFCMDNVLIVGDTWGIEARAEFEITEDEVDQSHPDEASGRYVKTASAEFVALIFDDTRFSQSDLPFVLASDIRAIEQAAAENWLEEN